MQSLALETGGAQRFVGGGGGGGGGARARAVLCSAVTGRYDA